MSRYRKPALPRPNRADALWRECLFAYAAGWEKGWYPSGPQFFSPAREDGGFTQGEWVGSIDANNYVVSEMGRSVDEGLSNDRVRWDDIRGRYDSTRVTAVVAIKPDVLHNDGRYFFHKYDAVDSGWNIMSSEAADPNPNGYRFVIADGAGSFGFSVANTQDTSRFDIIAMTYDQQNLKGFKNAQLIGQQALTFPIALNDIAIHLFGDGFTANAEATVGMCAVWSRPLQQQELARIYADPYIMWRNSLHKEFMFGPGGQGVPVGGISTYFLSF